jgi:replicative DNA helicase
MSLNDKGSERAVLAGIAQYGVDGYFEISDIIEPAVFTETKNQMIFNCFVYLFANDYKQIDAASIFSAANSIGVEEALKNKNDQEFIRSLFNFPINLENLRQLATKITKLYFARKAQAKHKVAHDKLNEINGDESIDSIISISEEPYVELMKELNTSEEDGDIGSNVDDYLDNKINNPVENIGIPTPFPIFNRVIGDGLRTGVHLIASRFKNGKSTFGKEVGIHVSYNLDFPVLYIDTEMQKEEQLDRILSSLSGIELRNVEKGKFTHSELIKIKETAQLVKNLKFKHVRVSGKTFKETLAIMKRWLNHKVGYNDEGKLNPHLIIYDYFKLVDTGDLKNMQEYQAMGFQIAALHDFCAENQTPILAFVQTNRDGLTKDTSDVIAQSDRLGWNCFNREQEFVTSEGVKSFKDFNHNDIITVLSHDGSWQKAIVKNYGKGYVNKLTFKKCNSEFSVKCTSNHRWILKNNIITDNIKINDILVKQANTFNFDYDNVSFEEQLYWCYGFVYGDGEFNGKRSQVRLCGKDIQYEYRFKNVGFKSSSSLSLKGDIICYTGKYNKTTPNPKIDSPNLIKAFVAGYIQADGIKNNNSGKKFIGIQSSEKDHIEFIRKCFPIAGIFITSETDLTGQITNFGVRPYTILFITNDKPDGSSTSNTKLVNIEKNVEFTDLWCLEVENTNSFVLPNGTPTGNCISLSLWKRKTPEEIAQDGPQNGTNKIIPLEGRFMERMEDGDYINFHFDTKRSIIKELNTKNAALVSRTFELKGSE